MGMAAETALMRMQHHPMAQKRSCSIVVLAWLVAFVLFFSGTDQAKADYVFTTLDVPGSTFTTVAGINNLGQIVGNSSAGSFLLSGGNFTRLNLPAPPNGINDFGQIVGGNFIYSGGSYTTLNAGPGIFDSTTASGINNAGQVVGFTYNVRSLETISFLYSGGTYTTNLIPDLHYQPAFGINNVGQVVGQALSFGYRFDIGDGSTGEFSVKPDASNTSAHGINDFGQIVGYWNLPDGIHHAFLLSGDSYTTFDVPGATMTDAYGINNAGEIVGTYVDVGGVQHGFVATPTAEPSTVLLVGIGMLSLIRWAWPRKKRG